MPGLPVELALYVASVLGAAAMVLLLPKPGPNLKPLGALLGAATLGGLWFVLCPLWQTGGDMAETGLDPGGLPFYYVFSFIGIAAAVRVITHHRPVYAALWFVMVILASAGLFLVLAAEFMALALVIIYGGAILVTYMFVIMLATQPQASDAPEDSPEFERFAREPLFASVAGFLLLAVLLTFVFDDGLTPTAAAKAPSHAEITETILTDRATAATLNEAGEVVEAPTPVGNTERVGLTLFTANPLAIELAGVILLLSLIGAVVIAKTHVPEENDPDDPTAQITREAAPPTV